MIALGQSPILITGTPGSGKTLLVMSIMLDFKGSVFYFGIPGVSSDLPWVEIKDILSFRLVPKPNDSTSHDVYFGDILIPPGSRLIIDECQRHFPASRPVKSVIPPIVKWLQTARHDGIECVFITQNPGLVDVALRQLISTHHHLIRLFGQKKVTCYSLNGGIISVNSTSSLKLCDKKSVSYNPKVFKLYKSAELHTVKFSIPHVIKVAALVTFVVLGGIFYKYIYPTISGSSGQTQASTGQAQASTGQDRSIDWVRGFVPVVRGLPYTAPAYSAIARPVSFPKISGCVSSRTRCACYTQQATRIDMDDTMCRQLSKNKHFDPFLPDKPFDDSLLAQRDKKTFQE